MNDAPPAVGIDFERSGGFAGMVLRTSVGPGDPDAAQWADLVAPLDLPALVRGNSQGGGPDRFSYAVTVTVGSERHALQYGEGAMPAELRPLVERLTERARRRP